MADTTLSRKDRRAKIAKASKIYGIKGQESLDLHEAYRALNQNDVKRAVQLAHPITKSHPKSVHAWVVMGGAALAQREGKTAQAFFQRALDFAPSDSGALVGLAKAFVLQADPYEAVNTAEQAFAAGADEIGLARLYAELMSEMGRSQAATDVLAPVALRLEDPTLCIRLADLLCDLDETRRAADWLERAWRIDPEVEAHRIARLRALVYLRKLDQANELADELLADSSVQDRDTVIVYKVMILRTTNRPEEALKVAEDHEFASPARDSEMRGVMANILQDIGRSDEADGAYLEGIHAGGTNLKIAKAYGVYLMRRGEYKDGATYYAERFEKGQRGHVPYENSAPENLEQVKHLRLIGEQGIGDQLALLSLLRLAPVELDKIEVSLVSDKRFVKALADNSFGFSVVDKKDFLAQPQVLARNELVYIGDLARYLDANNTERKQGAWVKPDAARLKHLRDKYLGLANGAPIIGAAWTSGSILGHLRSVTLQDLLTAVPEGALVVNLQYGDRTADIAAARKARPDLTILDDPEVDQMTDLAGFFAQIAAMDRVLSIDNTTVHACGVLGHPDTHVLVPTGSECMWYWGETESRDPWYGNLNLYRQTVLGEWEEPLSKLRQAVCP